MLFRNLFAILLLFLPMQLSAQAAAALSYGDDSYADAGDYTEYTPEELRQKYHKFTRIRNIGLSFTGVAAASVITGITMMSTADIRTFEETQSARAANPDTVFSDEDDGKFITGIMLIITAIPVSATGITLAAIGGNKRREYKHKLVMRGLEARASIRKPALSLHFDVY